MALSSDMRVTSNVDELTAYLEVRRKVTLDEGRRFVLEAANQHSNFVIRRRFRGYTANRNSGSILQRREGRLQGAIRVSDETKGREPSASSYVAGPLSYAQTQEFGATIRPKRRQYLTVPTRRALTKAGVLRQSARMTKRGGSWQTRGRVPGLVDRNTFIRRVMGTPIIFGRSRSGAPRALYVLKRSVKIKPRFGFMRSWDHIRPAREKLLDRMARKMLERER